MILGGIILLDCLVFLVFLAPQLLIHVGLRDTMLCALQALPFLVCQMPLQLVKERYFTAHPSKSPFVQRASLFQDLVIRCVRYAFANIPASIGAVFFSKHVALPFIRFRMLRHGYIKCPLHYSEIRTTDTIGIWITPDPTTPPDVVVLYVHGGGFSMGSAYFYLEFLMAWVSLLKSRQGYRNPAVYAVEYTLVPAASFPTQLQECSAGYDFVLSRLPDGNPARVCLAGDSAGATLVLSLLLAQAQRTLDGEQPPRREAAGLVTMISPWCRLLSDKNEDTSSDFLNGDSLALYARQYVAGMATGGDKRSQGAKAKGSLSSKYHIASPGDCLDRELWAAAPAKGYHFVYGSEEVFAPETENCMDTIRGAGGDIIVTKVPGIHAWPIVNLFLGSTVEERLKGLDRIVDIMGRYMVL